jgi:hypothetical protein
MVGSIMAWATTSLDMDVVARLVSGSLGVPVDAASLEAAGYRSSATQPGTASTAGKVTLVVGLLVATLGVVLIITRNAAIFILIVGLVGGGVALANMLTMDDRVKGSAPTLATQLSVAGSVVDAGALRRAIHVSLHAGIWLCLLGGIGAVIAGLIGLMWRRSAPTMAEGPADMGFGPPMA